MHSKCQPSKQSVQISMDETRLSYSFHGALGNIVKPKYWPNRRSPPVARVTPADTKGAVSYVAFLTPHADLQRRLPQVVLGRKSRFSFRTVQGVGRIPSTVKLIVAEKGWNNAKATLQILTLLHEALVDLPHLQAVFILDCHRCHLSMTVLEYARRLGLWVLFVPAGLTRLLQPLDFYAFHKFKSFVRSEFRQILMDKGDVTVLDWFKIVFQALTEFMTSQDWAPAFDFLGLRGSRATLCQTLLCQCPQLQEQNPPSVLQRHEVAMLLPRNFDVPYWVLFAAPRGVHRRILVF